MDHATLSITAPSNAPDPLGGSPGSLQVLSSSSQPHDQIHVLVQSLPELLGGGSLGGLEVLEMDGRLSLMESLSDVLSLADRESLMESLVDSLSLTEPLGLPEWSELALGSLLTLGRLPLTLSLSEMLSDALSESLVDSLAEVLFEVLFEVLVDSLSESLSD
ncbi:hypothetical protein [Planctomycetes bacterium TBK1r]|uniref:hypothetical protein n=1 Tax=Stieleria magnilauensis TaxID=2527963 RepID=UPI0011AAA109